MQVKLSRANYCTRAMQAITNTSSRSRRAPPLNWAIACINARLVIKYVYGILYSNTVLVVCILPIPYGAKFSRHLIFMELPKFRSIRHVNALCMRPLCCGLLKTTRLYMYKLLPEAVPRPAGIVVRWFVYNSWACHLHGCHSTAFTAWIASTQQVLSLNGGKFRC